MDAHPETVLAGRYRLLSPLGAGGMGTVWRAADELLDREVAVKLFAPATGHTGDAARRRTEMQLLARTAHPTIVALFDARLDEDPAFLVMELVEGEDLSARLARGPLSPAETRGVGLSIAAAIDSLARRNAVHRDIKPSNILLPADSSVVPAKLADFGIARLADEAGVTTAGTTIGTADYLSPEQVAGGAPTPKTDAYALGLVLLECLTGERAFPGTPTESAAARLAREPSIPESLSPEWRGLLAGLCRIDPAERLGATETLALLGRMPASGTAATATAPLTATKRLPAGGVTTATVRLDAAPADHPAPVAPRRRTRTRVAAIVAAIAVVAVIAVAVALSAARPRPAVTPGSGSPAPSLVATNPSPSPTPTPTVAKQPGPRGPKHHPGKKP